MFLLFLLITCAGYSKFPLGRRVIFFVLNTNQTVKHVDTKRKKSLCYSKSKHMAVDESQTMRRNPSYWLLRSQGRVHALFVGKKLD